MEILKKTTIARIEAQTRGRAADEVRRISLSGVPLLPEQLTPFTQLTHLTLVSMKPMLTSLSAIPFAQLPALRSLDVSDNAITVETDAKEDDSNNNSIHSSLEQLIMPNNRVTTMDELRQLAHRFPALTVLDLEDNPVDKADQREAIFDLFTELTTLDCRTRSGEEVVVVHSDEMSEEDESGSDADEEDESSDAGESGVSESDADPDGWTDEESEADEEDYDSDDEEDEVGESESEAQSAGSDQPGTKRMTASREAENHTAVSHESEGESNSSVAQDGEATSDVKRARVE